MSNNSILRNTFNNDNKLKYFSNSGAAFYVIYVLFKYSVDITFVNVLADIIFWFGMIFLAPFSLLNCFEKYFDDAFNPDGKLNSGGVPLPTFLLAL